MKLPVAWKAIILVFIILFIDQILKFWIKTHMSIGQDFAVFGNWFLIHFVENPGMAFGWELGGKSGKVFLSLFRLAAIVAIIWYVRALIREKAPQGFILCVALILAGAIGNMIDCAFYGLIFDSGTTFNTELGTYVSYPGVSQLSSDGYAPFLHGCVVDMLSFPIFRGAYPGWFPFNAGEPFLFFRPVFNVADSAVTIGVFSIVIFYWGYLKRVSKS
ncbi:MAG: lipoprotein signal peptidase [Bacteroidales bacterium]|jgi:signal peptidase II|nr:lipoprotein signal peptidase [Bacteroidales bacterium]